MLVAKVAPFRLGKALRLIISFRLLFSLTTPYLQHHSSPCQGHKLRATRWMTHNCRSWRYRIARSFSHFHPPVLNTHDGLAGGSAIRSAMSARSVPFAIFLIPLRVHCTASESYSSTAFRKIAVHLTRGSLRIPD